MQTIKNNYDRVLALSTAFVCLIVSSVLVVKSFAVGERYKVKITETKTVAEFEVGETADWFAHLEREPHWDPPVGADGRVRSALVSAPVFHHDGELIPAYGGPPIRGEVPNPWLIEHGLPIERSDVLRLDSDGDKFTNGEEYHLGMTDPNDASSHPDVLHKLRLAGVSSEDYVLKFASGAGGKLNVRRVKGARDFYWRDWFEIGDVFPGGRFNLVAVADDGQSITIREVDGGGEFVLKRKEEKNLPIYSAKLRYLIEPLPARASRLVRGDSFRLGKSGIQCAVEQVKPQSVALRIVRPDGKAERLVLKVGG